MVIFKLNATKFEKVGAIGSVSHLVMSNSLQLVDCSLPSSSVHGILQARILKWVPIPFSRGSSQPRDQTQIYYIADRLFTVRATREAQEYWRGLLFPSPGHLPDPGIELGSLH